MSIPGFQSFLLPTLELADDGAEHSLAQAREVIADRFHLTEADRAEILPSGRQRRFDNRVAWAKSYLEEDEASWDAAWLAEAERRGKSADANPESVRSAADVIAEPRAKYSAGTDTERRCPPALS